MAPRTLEGIASLSGRAPPRRSHRTPPRRGGEPADDATAAAIVATARELVACSNAGDILRRLALYSDDRLRFAYPDGPTTGAGGHRQDQPLPLALPDRVALLSVDDVRMLPDGRVSARRHGRQSRPPLPRPERGRGRRRNRRRHG